ncbi:hypothetical protein OCAE111667_05275 [Occultella aeris]|uniref:Uncharacterized protein n=1 Tax=Occultella aeris TaxID=2761496 RepID=A0A7M4DM58_9MICO|nr:hypothetical protein [Occultella aeris]VZO38390.1 hypothetical protein HALOF300_03226 [Occultella aeris]
MTHLDVPRRSLSPTQLVNLRGWAVTGASDPNATAWDHINDLTGLRERLLVVS